METIKQGTFIVCLFKGTPVVKFNSQKIILNTGGWFTYTTKRKMNEVSNNFGLGFSIFQKKGEWIVDYKGEWLHMTGNTLTLRR